MGGLLRLADGGKQSQISLFVCGGHSLDKLRQALPAILSRKKSLKPSSSSSDG